MRSLLAVGALLLVGLSGCFGFDPTDDGFSFTPGEDWKPTGNTVHLKASVVDYLFHEIYPGFQANLWAFCFEPADPDDDYSRDAIEYWNTMESDGVNGQGFENQQWRCSVPGPTIRVKQGDLVKVDFVNNHFHCHTIHWHGQHVPWQDDGAPGVNQESVCRGKTYSYEFVAARAGSLWYHCHVDTHFHVMQGLYGAFIVEPQDTTWEPQDIDEEYVLVYSSLQRELVQVTKELVIDPHAKHRPQPDGCGETGKQGCQNPPVDVMPDTWLLNGRSLPHTMMDEKSIVRVDEGDRVKIRLFNFGETFETIHTHGHDMYVTHRDGNPLPPSMRFWVDTLTIGPAERYDVVIEANNPGLWMMHTHVDHQSTNGHQAPGGAMSMIVYRAVEEQEGTMMPFAVGAELTGGRPYVEPMVGLPADVSDGAQVPVSGANPNGVGVQPVDADVPVAISTPCALARLTVQAVFQSDLPNEITRPQGIQLSLRDAQGTPVADPVPFEADGTLIHSFDPIAPDTKRVLWQEGEHAIHLGGQANGAGNINLFWSLDYYTAEELDQAPRALQDTACDPRDRIIDYVAFAKEMGAYPNETAWPPKPE